MVKENLTGEAFRTALNTKDAAALRQFVAISKLLILLHQEKRRLICEALGTNLEEVKQWDMTFKARQRIEAIIGCEWEQVTPASVPKEVKEEVTASNRKKRIADQQDVLIAAEELVGTFPRFEGQKRIKTLHATRFNPDYLDFLNVLMSKCKNESQKKALMKREGLDLGKMTETLKRAASKK